MVHMPASKNGTVNQTSSGFVCPARYWRTTWITNPTTSVFHTIETIASAMESCPGAASIGKRYFNRTPGLSTTVSIGGTEGSDGRLPPVMPGRSHSDAIWTTAARR